MSDTVFSRRRPREQTILSGEKLLHDYRARLPSAARRWCPSTPSHLPISDAIAGHGRRTRTELHTRAPEGRYRERHGERGLQGPRADRACRAGSSDTQGWCWAERLRESFASAGCRRIRRSTAPDRAARGAYPIMPECDVSTLRTGRTEHGWMLSRCWMTAPLGRAGPRPQGLQFGPVGRERKTGYKHTCLAANSCRETSSVEESRSLKR